MGRFAAVLFLSLFFVSHASAQSGGAAGIMRSFSAVSKGDGEVYTPCGKTMCTSKEVCYNGRCEDNCALPDYECPSGMTCNEKRKVCEMSCASKADCPPGMFCADYGRCERYCRGNVTFSGKVCEGTTPECFERPDLGKAFCGCVDGSCSEGMYCRNKKCVPCPKGRLSVKGQSCGCSPGSAASGKGYCRPCQKGQNCNCPKGRKTNGEGDCVVCVTSDDCGKSGVYCKDAGTLTAECVPLVCREGTYMQGNDCLSCPEGCGVCPFGERCTDCMRGWYMEYGVCQSCAVRFGTGCGHCFIHSDRCEECAFGYSMRADGTCQQIECPEGTFLDGEECVRCSDTLPHCSKCSDAKTCLACEGEAYYWNNGVCDCKKGYVRDEETGECNPIECAYGHYYDIDAESCRPCASAMRGCLECSSGNKCDVCDWENSFLMGGDNRCTKLRCASDSFPQNGQCKPCSTTLPSCTRCSADGTVCVKCENGKRLKNGRCEEILCGAGTYKKKSKCFSCKDKFAACSDCSEKRCFACEKTYILIGNECRPVACNESEFMYLNPLTAKCEKCPSGFKPAGTKCEPIICPKGAYLSGYECKLCPANCESCGKDGRCDRCVKGMGFVDIGNTCKECPFGSFLKGTVCVLCSDVIEHCVECSSDGKMCFDCGEYKKTVLNRCAE